VARTFTAKGSGYFPHRSKLEGGLTDVRDKKLNTLQSYLAKKATYVSTAMDAKLSIAYGTVVQIPELEKLYGRTIEFRVVDIGGHFDGKGYTAIDVCVASRKDTLEPTLNGMLTLIFAD
jgi:hypothetical protein